LFLKGSKHGPSTVTLNGLPKQNSAMKYKTTRETISVAINNTTIVYKLSVLDRAPANKAKND